MFQDNLETSTNSNTLPSWVADALSHLDGFARSISGRPVFPPNTLGPLVSGILRATRPLIDTDHDWIFPNIALLKDQISAYDTLLDRMSTIRAELKNVRETTLKISCRYSSMLAPIRRLPSDVLRFVFLETRYLGADTENRDPLYGRMVTFLRDPLTFGQVCGAWRDVVVSSPELWSNIKVEILSTPIGYWGRHLWRVPALLKTTLPRSGQSPLDINFKAHEFDQCVDEGVQAFSLILGERHRWKTARLELTQDLLRDLRAADRKLLCLESLKIGAPRVQEVLRSVPLADVSDVFLNAPSLQWVTLCKLHNLGSFTFPLQITHLAGSLTAIHNLAAYRLLEELHLEFIERDVHTFSPPHPITLPRIRRLWLSSLHMLPHLCLPSLQNLTFGPDPLHPGGRHGSTEAMKEQMATIFINFLRTSHCSLTSLATGSNIVYAPNFVQEGLPMLGSLTKLVIEIDVAPYENGFFRALTSFPGFLPNLQSLHLYLTRPPPLQPPRALSSMITSRLQHCCTIKVFYHDIMTSSAAALQRLRKLGIDPKKVDDYDGKAGIMFGVFTRVVSGN